jgi:glycosyltransferase involved in cell wall biosynthesis
MTIPPADTPCAAPPQVSVILPTYNRDWILAEAIDSVLGQRYPDLELIVVDDGSTDRTAELLASYGERLRHIQQPNRGVSAARNTGIAAARGSLIAFLDSDDLWLPGKVTAQVRYFNTHPHISICQTEEFWIRKGKRVNPKNRHRKASGMIFDRSLELCLISPSAVMLRRELLDRVGGFDETLPACEDYDLWLRISCRYPVGLIDTPLIRKRGGHPDQLSAQAGLDQYRIQSLDKILTAGILNPDQRKAAIRVLTAKCEIYAGGCRKRGRHEEGERYLDVASKYSRVRP